MFGDVICDFCGNFSSWILAKNPEQKEREINGIDEQIRL